MSTQTTNREANKMIKGYRLVKILGTGATSKVYLAEKDGQKVALKVFKDSKHLRKCVANELSSVLLVPAKHAVKPVECFLAQQSTTLGKEISGRQRSCIAYEFAPNGDFFDTIHASGKLPLPIVKYYMH